MLSAVSVYAIAVVVAILVGWRGRVRRLPAGQVAARDLPVLYLGWISGATFLPLPLAGHAAGEGLAGALNHLNLVPLRSIRATLALPDLWPRVRLLAGNVVVFVPFGLLLPAIWPRLSGFGRMALAGLLFGLTIELGQLGVSLLLGYWYRMSNVDDLLLNVRRVLLVWGVYRVLGAGGLQARDVEVAAAERK